MCTLSGGHEPVFAATRVVEDNQRSGAIGDLRNRNHNVGHVACTDCGVRFSGQKGCFPFLATLMQQELERSRSYGERKHTDCQEEFEYQKRGVVRGA